MRLPIVDSRTIPVEFDHLRVQRLDATTRVHERVEVRPDRDSDGGAWLTARVEPAVHEPQEYELDAVRSEQLVEALRRIVDTPQPAPAGGDPERFHFMIDVGWDGRCVRFEVAGVSSDDAVHGVLSTISSMLHAAQKGTSHDLTSHLRAVDSPSPE